MVLDVQRHDKTDRKDCEGNGRSEIASEVSVSPRSEFLYVHPKYGLIGMCIVRKSAGCTVGNKLTATNEAGRKKRMRKLICRITALSLTAASVSFC